MKMNKIGYLGFLGFTGLFGILNYWLFFFFSFFTLFAFLKSDERIERNIGCATRNTFVFDTIIATFALVYTSTSTTFEAMPAFAALLSQGLTIFSLSYWYYNQKED